MFMMNRGLFILMVAAMVMVPACVKKKIAALHKGNATGRYGSEFPSGNATGEIEKITRSVKKIYSVSSYTTYQFKREAKITGYQLQLGTWKREAWGVISTSETVFGTATIIGFMKAKVALLTCAHIVTSPDTLISWFEPTDEDPSQYIQSISLKEKQENWVKDLSTCGTFTVLASDIQSDIAILGKNCESLTDTVVPFPYHSGYAKDLGWGSFVYIFGYPMGSQVITKGITSPAPKRPMGEFSIDALLNKGYSGGIILASREGMPGFELVGMVKTVNSTREEFLKPSSDQQRTPDWLPYKGDVYIGTSDNIQYGLNAVVPIETIHDFYTKNRQELILKGYNLDNFFVPEKH
jgi:hypothetical protein